MDEDAYQKSIIEIHKHTHTHTKKFQQYLKLIKVFNLLENTHNFIVHFLGAISRKKWKLINWVENLICVKKRRLCYVIYVVGWLVRFVAMLS